ncbi:hypothetical protein L3Q82_016519 [Scortum barcoo]|uniref:Uncharacterized protein n=1 Tax=Scortum barcoo TaxID=214431 RepID=A0ACB8X7G5_9TELE|nr:hypothetical protein L3Q82_016519 [Scortum barcoo]
MIMIRKGKDCYRRKMEHQLQQNNICGVWKGLKTISGFKEPKSQPVGDQGWANDLNLFFNRFDQASAPPPAQSPLLQPPSCSVPPVHCSSCAPPHLTFSSHPPDTSISHSVLCTSPPSTPPCSSLLLTSHQVRNALKKNRARKAAGPDGISSRLLKSCADQLCGILGYTFNLSLKLGRVPQLWKMSCIVPVPKTPHPKGAQQLQAGSSDVSSDEDAGETGPRPSAPAAQAAGGQAAAASWGGPHHLTTWILDYLTHRPQFVRVQGFESDRLLCSTGAPQGTVLAPFLFTLYTADFSYNTPSCHLQKFSDDSAVVGLITDGDDREYRGLIQDFADWCLRNNLQINAGKTKELVVDFRRRRHSPPAPVSIQGTDIDTVKSYKYLGVHLNDSLDWSDNTDCPCQEGQQQTVPAQEAEVFWSAGTTPQDLL